MALKFGFQFLPYHKESAATGPELDPEAATLLKLVRQAFSSYRDEPPQNLHDQTSPAIQNLRAYASSEQGQSLLGSLHQGLEAELEVSLLQLRQQFQALQPTSSHELYEEYQQKEQLLRQLEQQQQQKLQKQQLQQQQQHLIQQLIQQQQAQQQQEQQQIEQLLLCHAQQEQMHASPPPGLAQTESRFAALTQLQLLN
eukprot:TRINITY_DN11170_c0_g3_i1.p1 TRINITY_DN11170_c0_g3~~TRINITY_DN11170_c0_g3_i1.p1  ORF type:complete len:198 (-),score=65.66 TRINITY_DN11170_c0_g3_i1:438-1031(-)